MLPRIFAAQSARYALLLTVLGLAPSAMAYIGPGAGFAVASSLFAILATVGLALLTLLTWPFMSIIRTIRHRRAFGNARVDRLVILGLDGLEPSLVEKFMSEGKLPNFVRLKEMGGYHKLGTTLPPLSPVAWSTFSTGSNPGKHNVYDFLNSDRRTYLPTLSSVDIRPPTRMLSLGKFKIPLNKPEIRLLRKGKPFWTTLGEHGIFSTIIRVPITFPPESFRGVLLSAMCAPDLRGSQGTFSFYSTQRDDTERTGGEQITVQRNGNKIESHLVGPENSLKPDAGTMHCPFTVTLGDKPNEATLHIGGDRYALKPGVYTPWIEVDFPAGLGMNVSGICRFLLNKTEPDFELYVTPINLHPEKPAMPISHPAAYSNYLAKRFGSYATLGLAEDTWALNEELIDDDAFREQCDSIDDERELQFFDALDKTNRGLVVCVIDGSDRIQHMFWRYLEDDHPANPANHPTGSGNPGDQTVERMYKRMDKLVGKTLDKVQRAGGRQMLMVISDHGFASFQRGIDLNAWLIENGYMKLKPDAKPGTKYLQGIDWSQTKAYTLGLAGMFINQKGRESNGIVAPGAETEAIKAEIIEKLTGLVDPKNGQTAILNVYDKLKAYTGPYRDTAPDLIIGYNRGWRIAWDTAIGRITDAVFHDNTKAWSGDHCIEPELIPACSSARMLSMKPPRD
jgi:predicted AlkP superfamily phosphohydrolase/phosphomutase